MRYLCPKCHYKWKSKLENDIPKKCPRCQKRLDYKVKPIVLESEVATPKTQAVQEVEKE